MRVKENNMNIYSNSGDSIKIIHIYDTNCDNTVILHYVTKQPFYLKNSNNRSSLGFSI